jgi:MoxR-like ATPase
MPDNPRVSETAADLAFVVETTGRVRAELAKVLIGQQTLVDRLLIGLMTGGHILLEGVPGLAKTLAARSLAAAIGAHFKRIQFTPDLLPADLIGTEVYNPRTSEFSVRQGPIFAQVVLADEINRAPAKVQSALLEAMQEKQVTIGRQSFVLPDLFLVLATQNPIEHEGTYALPEAQVDRFLMKVRVSYPSRADEERIIDRMAVTAADLTVEAVANPDAILELRQHVDAVYLDDKVRGYILDVVRSTRDPLAFGLTMSELIQLGASPRAAIAVALASRAYALLQGRDYVEPHDVKAIGLDVLRHRVLTSFEAEAQGLTSDDILERILAGLAVP